MKMKMVALLATGGMMLQFGGCNFGGFWRQMGIGFARGVGEIPVVLINQLIAPFLPDLSGVGGGGDGDNGG
jgi:hypothetical protein